ncbi:MAG: hypothetical protein APF77_19955 [Clostridia bacterium BRH_c25]|nr:MAG: hypothetical protein APF77_19955 [Clostridia bacterium BRH_c25]
MPALLTHYLCGNAMLKLVEDDHMRNSILNHRNVFNLGTQGPDIFFYYGAWPWTKNKGMTEFGDRMHEERTGEFILEALKYSAGYDEPSKSVLAAYMCGYLCHYVLDCHTHPYIFYKTGFVRTGEAYTSKYTCYHRMFETALDVLMLNYELGKRPPEFNAAEQIKISGHDAAVIGKMYSVILKKVYDEKIDTKLVCQAIADISGIAAVLRDKTGIKKILLSKIEKSLGRPPMFSSMILPLEINDGLDYLNISHSAWKLPWDNSVALTSSFIESFEAAAKEAKLISIDIIRCISERTRIEDAASLIGNRSFSTGIDCNLDIELKYFDCIYEKS